MEELKKEIRDIKEFILINVTGTYNIADVDKEFKTLLEQNREYIKNNK